MSKKHQGIILAAIFACGGLFTSQALADEPASMGNKGKSCNVECKDSAAATQMMNDLMAGGSSPEEAMVLTLDKYGCAVEAVVAAALQAADENQYGNIIQTALSLAGQGCRTAVMSGAVLAGVDPTPYMGIPGNGAKGLPGIVNRHHGTASES